MAVVEKMRIDKWLWAVRIFKTRSLSSDACRAGRVKVEGKSVKPSYMLKVGETVRVQKGEERKVVKVVKLILKRVGAPIAAACYEDHSPKPAPRSDDALRSFFHIPVVKREKGTGRPTKRDRRKIDKHFGRK